MTVIKCDICGAECPDWEKVRQVQIRKRHSMYDTRLSLEKSLDVCMSCINDILEGGTKCEKTEGPNITLEGDAGRLFRHMQKKKGESRWQRLN